MTTIAPVTIEPGIHEGMPFDQYIALPAISNSRLKWLERSPAYCRLKIDEDEERTTEALQVGSLLHMMLLEPELAEARYLVHEKLDRRTKVGKGAWQDIQDEAAESGKEPIEQELWDRAREVADSVKANPSAAAVLDNADQKEVTLVWVDEPTGELCKARIDFGAAAVSLFGDVKTSRAAHPDSFGREIHNFRYYRQGAWYRRGLDVLGLLGRYADYGIIAVENTAPFECYPYRLRPEDLDAGAVENEYLVNIYHRCQVEGRWPGGQDEFQNISLPPWAVKVDEEGGW